MSYMSDSGIRAVQALAALDLLLWSRPIPKTGMLACRKEVPSLHSIERSYE